jgi:hypothetical protein
LYAVAGNFSVATILRQRMDAVAAQDSVPVSPILLRCTSNDYPVVWDPQRPDTWCMTTTEYCVGVLGRDVATNGSAACACRAEHAEPGCDRCAAGDDYVFPDCILTRDECRASRCNSSGACIDGAAGGCVCDDGATGPGCANSSAVCSHASCSSHGYCVPSTAVGNTTAETRCACDEGWAGYACNITAAECGAAFCSNRGVCVGGDDGFVMCACEANRTGFSCETEECARGGVPTGVEGTPCTCPRWTSGLRCETDTCGFGIVTQDGDCVCDANRRKNTSRSDVPACYESTCGPNGTPVDSRRCACTRGYEPSGDGVIEDVCQRRRVKLSDAQTLAASDPPTVEDYDGRWAVFVFPLAAAVLNVGLTIKFTKQ